MFERFFADKPARSFYACAVHRTRKGCSFFRWSNEPLPQAKRDFYMTIFRDHQVNAVRPYEEGVAGSLLEAERERRRYCHTCQVLYAQTGCHGDADTGGGGDDHLGHTVNADVSDNDLLCPTASLLYPHTDSKGQAVSYAYLLLWL